MQSIKSLLPLAINGSQELAKQEYKPPRSIEEQQFEHALTEKKLWHCDGEEEMKQALRYIFILVGLRAQNYPAGVEKQLLHAYIYKNYGGHTPAELKLAFEMALQNKLSLRLEDVTCYENFSIAYFSRIMEAYREWAKEQIKRLPAPAITRRLTEKERIDINLIWALKWLNEINKLPCKV
jgi:hypothetical protein